MKIPQVRNATLLVDYAGKRFLVDPMLAERGAYPGFPGAPNGDARDPTVDLPVAAEALLGVDAVVVTHTHLDHWDDAAKALVPKHLPIFVQDERDAADIRAAGFGDTRVLGTLAAARAARPTADRARGVREPGPGVTTHRGGRAASQR
jgi:L-ascorbate metabolism protein UlaG (beta-lactamase superfamily)